MVSAIKLYVITKRTIIAVAAAVVAVILIVAAIVMIARNDSPAFSQAVDTEWPDVEAYELEVIAAARRELPIYNVGREDNKIALTIDAAWEDSRTIEILDILDDAQIKATWFLCGFWVKNCPDAVKELQKRGHEIGNHSATHPHMSKQSAAQIAKELSDMDDSLEKVIGKRSTLFRAPFGEYDDNVIRTARSAGYEVVQWDVDTIDWKEGTSVDFVIERVLSKTKSGSIILCHNNAQYIVDYLPKLISALKEKGFVFVKVSEMILPGDTTIDPNGTQHKAEKSA